MNRSNTGLARYHLMSEVGPDLGVRVECNWKTWELDILKDDTKIASFPARRMWGKSHDDCIELFYEEITNALRSNINSQLDKE